MAQPLPFKHRQVRVKKFHKPYSRMRENFTSAMERQRNGTSSSAVALRAMAGQASKASGFGEDVKKTFGFE